MTVAPGRTARARRTLGALLLAGALASCSLLDGDGPTLEPEPIAGAEGSTRAPEGLQSYYEQQIGWRECRGRWS